jgi:deoxyribodipyrimidine photo-lyase
MTERGAEGEATLVWLRRDLRLAANPALVAAADLARRRGSRLLPVFVWEPRARSPWAPGAAARWWLWRSLAALDGDLRRTGSRLAVVAGAPAPALAESAQAATARAVVWAAGMDPRERADDEVVADALAAAGIETLVVSPGNLLLDPAGPLTRDGRPYTVFTPYWRASLARLAAGPASPLPQVLQTLPEAPQEPLGLTLGALEAEAAPPWSCGFGGRWRPGEAGAAEQLARFLEGAVGTYEDDRDRPDLRGTSRLSPHLHWGEITAPQVWRAVEGTLAEAGLELEAAVARGGRDADEAPGLTRSAGAFLRQLGWREFGHHLLYSFPSTPEHPLRPSFARFPWREDPAALHAWQHGLTGYPFVDAGMRELWTTGWMHNRARLVAASFLVKHLLLPWRLGEDWFWDTLVDADLADNALGWQWVAGSGADAAPYFRIFNPVTQGRRYDPDGAYVRRWVPEISGLDAAHLHAPWTAPASALAAAGVVLDETYPSPIVDHGEARARALAAYDVARNAGR